MLAGDLRGERAYPFKLHSTGCGVGELPKIEEGNLILTLFYKPKEISKLKYLEESRKNGLF